jgi:predicted oxidoreductase
LLRIEDEDGDDDDHERPFLSFPQLLRARDKARSFGVEIKSNSVELSLAHPAPLLDGTIGACRDLGMVPFANQPLAGDMMRMMMMMMMMMMRRRRRRRVVMMMMMTTTTTTTTMMMMMMMMIPSIHQVAWCRVSTR